MEPVVEWTASVWRRITSRMPNRLAGVSWVPGRRPLAWFLVWLVSLIACVVAGGAGPDAWANSPWGRWLASAPFLAWLLQLLASTELLLALFDEDPGVARLRRGIRLAPWAGAAAAALAALFVAAFATSGTWALQLRVLPFGTIAYVGGLAYVLVSIASLYQRLAAARFAPMAVFLTGWIAWAAAVAHDAWLTPGADAAGAWLSPGYGALFFAFCATGVLLHALHEHSQRRALTQRNLLDSARKYRHVYYSAPVALMSVDRFGQILRWNDLAAALFRNELHQGRVNTIGAVFGGDRAETLLREVTGTGRHASELTLRLDDGDAGQRTCAVDALLAGDAIEISLVDVTERTVLARTLEHMAYHDPTTDCLNLRGLEREIALVCSSLTSEHRASLLYVGLKWFKAITDLFGHAIGNSVVVELSRRLAQALPESARVARLGGDEFLVVLPGCGLERGRVLGQAAIDRIDGEPFEVDGKRIRVEASIGAVEVAPDMGVAELIAYANAACDEARRNGTGRIVAAESSREHLARYRAEVELGRRMRSSLPTERMCVHAQPIVSLRQAAGTPVLTSYEALLRERDENGNISSPARLIAAAERHGAMCAVDLFMLERTLQHLRGNPRHTAALDFVTVNLSGISLNDERFLADAHALLFEAGDVASKICLEITESVALYDLASTRRFVERMRSLGVGIALDDFGAGHSSFAYLRELPASLVKLDGQFMLRIGQHPRNQVIVESIRRLTEGLGIACLAEWVEDVEALEFLLRIGMDHAQGFVLAKPLPIERWLTQPLDLGALEEARRRVSHGGVPAMRTTKSARPAGRPATSAANESTQAVPT